VAKAKQLKKGMARGNQRELARKKNEKKNPKGGKKPDDGLTLLQKRERDAAAIREKVKAKEAAQANG
jgi:hypothetical protein